MFFYPLKPSERNDETVMLKNVVFDMGEVLLHWDPLQPCLRHCEDAETAGRLHEFIFRCPEWYEIMDAGKMYMDEYSRMMQERAAESDRPYIRKILSDYYIDSLYPVKGMRELAEALPAEGYRVFLLSNVSHDFYLYTYKMPFLRLFDGVMLSCEEQLRKPDPEIFRRLCERFGLVPGETLFVDDVPANCEGARAVGLNALCFGGDAAQARAEIDRLSGKL